jgi:protein SCO1
MMLRLAALGLMLAGCAANAGAHFRGMPVAIAAPDFTLESDAATPWSLSAQHGKLIALFFGYTNCTDTCPDTLAKLAAAMNHAGGTPDDAEVAFVTVDPKRDTPARLHAYLRRFSGARIVGLTGTPAQIAAVENAYHAWSDANDDHSSFTILIDRSGEERVVHDEGDSEAAYTHDMRTLLN